MPSQLWRAALAQLRRIQRQCVCINQGSPVTDVSTVECDQALMLAALNIKNPTAETLLSVLEWKPEIENHTNQASGTYSGWFRIPVIN